MENELRQIYGFDLWEVDEYDKTCTPFASGYIDWGGYTPPMPRDIGERIMHDKILFKDLFGAGTAITSSMLYNVPSLKGRGTMQALHFVGERISYVINNIHKI